MTGTGTVSLVTGTGIMVVVLTSSEESGLIWVQTVCKSHQQMAKIATST